MSVKFGLLGLLAKQAQHGYELKRTFEEITGGSWQLNHGQIYQSLLALEQGGLVRHTVQHDEALPDRKVYELTGAGRAALAEWLDNPEPRVRPLRDELFIRLAVMSTSPVTPLLDLIAGHRSIYLARMSELTDAKSALADAAENTRANTPASNPATTPENGTKYSAEARDAVLMEMLLLDAAIYHCEADLRWLDHCETTLALRAGSGPN